MTNLKLGIIGTNFVVDWLCDAVDSSEGIVNHAVYSRTSERGNEFAAKHSIPNVYTDMEEFLSSDIDAVYIASPNFLHGPQAIAAMNHGKHVLVEKPAALSAAEFDEMLACAKANNVVLIEAMRPAHDEALADIREAMTDIGPIRRAVLEFCQYSSRYDKFRAGEVMNAFNPALGNAAVMDIGVYALEVCVLLFGAPKEIISRSVILENGFEGMGTV
ncbi:MAG: Gfo/Idh/MocA family oxidoreductase, partial [Clostridia bacterium]|nr:Gfo/Idh/MocA family oxidoreductase [Clostridia bacterium]